MSDKKYAYQELVPIVTDAMSDWFENLDDYFVEGDEGTDHKHTPACNHSRPPDGKHR